VLRDFDVSGFSIFGTLGTDSRRYTFANDMSSKIHDIGLRLADVEAMDLQSETVEVKNRAARRETLEEHSAAAEEIEFLVPEDEDTECRRVELNAMTSRQLIDFVEAALNQFGVGKVVPDDAVVESHARHCIATKLTEEIIAEHAEEIAERAAVTELPAGLVDKLWDVLSEEPELSWDQALARLM
jgi:hypothetical protein